MAGFGPDADPPSVVFQERLNEPASSGRPVRLLIDAHVRFVTRREAAERSRAESERFQQLVFGFFIHCEVTVGAAVSMYFSPDVSFGRATRSELRFHHSVRGESFTGTMTNLQSPQ